MFIILEWLIMHESHSVVFVRYGTYYLLKIPKLENYVAWLSYT